MRRRQIKVEVLLGLVMVLVFTGAGGMLLRPAGKPDQTLRARFGDVDWNHDLHARMQEIATCTVCHHTERQGIVSPRPCEDCHTLFTNQEAVLMADLYMEKEERTYEGEQGPPAMEIFHGSCLGCHKAMNAGPVGCRDCHDQTFSGPHGMVAWDHRTHARKMDLTCVKCHHKDTEAETDGDYRACGVCHEHAELLELTLATGILEHEDAKHGKCHTCHTEYNPENDPRTCVDCHKGMKRTQEDQAPSLEEALHLRCMECHSIDYPDRTPSMPLYCTDCHKPDPSVIADPDLGPVLFSHKRHAEYEEWTCDACHHTDVPGEPHTACYGCHGTGHFAGIPSLAEAMHTNCLGCHEEKGVELTKWESFQSRGADLRFFKFEGEPGVFWWDHRFHAVSLALSCRECHHNIIQKDGVYVTAARLGAAWPEASGFIQTCRNCHGQDGPVQGSVAEGTSAKSLEGAYEKVCTACHQRLECGPLYWKDFFESQ